MTFCFVHSFIAALAIVGNLLVVLLCSLLVGAFIGFACTILLSRIFNNFRIEIVITIGAGYLTVGICEYALPTPLSGVLAVVALGLVMNSTKTCISREVEKSLHE